MSLSPCLDDGCYCIPIRIERHYALLAWYRCGNFCIPVIRLLIVDYRIGSEMLNNNKRPVFLNLFKIHLPVTAVLSLAHRFTGIVLFLMIPVLIYFLDLSLDGPEGFERVHQLVQQPLMRSALILIAWFLAHHFFAGIRYLLIDIDIGVAPAASRRGAWLVMVAGIITVILVSLGVL